MKSASAVLKYAVFALLGFAVLTLPAWVGAFTGPSVPSGTGYGMIDTDAAGNLGFDIAVSATTKLLIKASSTSASEYVLRVLQSDGTTPIFIIRNDNKIAIGGNVSSTVLAVGGDSWVNGNLTATTLTGSLTGTVNAANVSAGNFASSTGGGNFSFPGSLAVGTTSTAYKLVVSGDAQVSGGVKIGTVTAACGASYEGTIRYNSTSKVNEYCDGTNWTTLGGATSTLLIWTGPTSGTQDMSASTTKAFTTPGSYSIIVTKTMTLTFRGAAGGGGGAIGNFGCFGCSPRYGGPGGGGGGGGAVTTGTNVQLVPNKIYVLDVGSGGAGGTGGAGGAGGVTRLRNTTDNITLVNLNGGSGGSYGSAGTGGAGGAGGALTVGSNGITGGTGGTGSTATCSPANNTAPTAGGSATNGAGGGGGGGTGGGYCAGAQRAGASGGGGSTSGGAGGAVGAVIGQPSCSVSTPDAFGQSGASSSGVGGGSGYHYEGFTATCYYDGGGGGGGGGASFTGISGAYGGGGGGGGGNQLDEFYGFTSPTGQYATGGAGGAGVGIFYFVSSP